MTHASNSGWVEVSIPEDLVVDVYAFIAERRQAEPPEGETHPDTEGDGARSGWTPEIMKRCYRESPDSMKAVLEHLAERPDEWVGTGTLVGVAGYSERSEMAGVFGAFGRRVKNRYGMDSWPMERHWSHEDGERKVRLPAELAEIVRKELDDTG